MRKSKGQLNSLKLPRNNPTCKIVAVTPEELIKLAPHCGRYQALALMTGLCGLRLAEVIGLQAQDVDLAEKQIIRVVN